jgi:hypothetical protein
MSIPATINKKFKLGGAHRKVRGEKISGGVEKFTLGI